MAILMHLIPDLKCFTYSFTLISFDLHKIDNEVNMFLRLSFTYCYTGELRSLHDARVFRKTEVDRNIVSWVPARNYIIRDSAYPLNS